MSFHLGAVTISKGSELNCKKNGRWNEKNIALCENCMCNLQMWKTVCAVIGAVLSKLYVQSPEQLRLCENYMCNLQMYHHNVGDVLCDSSCWELQLFQLAGLNVHWYYLWCCCCTTWEFCQLVMLLMYPERPLSLPECRLTSVPANSGTPYVLF